MGKKLSQSALKDYGKSTKQERILDSYQLNLVQKAQEIFYNPRKASDIAGFRRMNGHSTFSGYLISAPRSEGFFHI